MVNALYIMGLQLCNAESEQYDMQVETYYVVDVVALRVE